MDKTILGTSNELVTVSSCATDATQLALDIEVDDDVLAGAHLDITGATLLRDALSEWIRSKMSPDFVLNVRIPEIEAGQRNLAEYINAYTPEGWGFALFQFTFGPGGSCFYVSNGTREDIVSMLKEFTMRNTQ